MAASQFKSGSLRMNIEEAKKSPLVSNNFKMFVVSTLFLLVSVHLYSLSIEKQVVIISDKVQVIIALVLIVYLWVQELRDRIRMQILNQAFVDTQQQLELVQVDTIAVLILTEEAKDPFVRGHSERVARFSLEIAKKMKLSKERQAMLERASILHDLGKLGMTNDLVRKKDKLTDEEWQAIRNHPKRGADILKPLEFLSQEQEIILHHHERYDGKGYPDGLKGSEIPIEARIIAVADTFDAMNSARPYRKNLSKDAIINELKNVSGSQLDPEVTRVFLSLLSDSKDFWEKG